MYRRFKEVALPHLAATYRLARRLIRNHEDAEEVVKEAYLSAFKSFHAYRGGDSRVHMRSLNENHPVDVASAEPGRLEQWFKDRLPYSSSIKEGHTLVGGRLDFPYKKPLAAVAQSFTGVAKTALTCLHGRSRKRSEERRVGKECRL